MGVTDVQKPHFTTAQAVPSRFELRSRTKRVSGSMANFHTLTAFLARVMRRANVARIMGGLRGADRIPEGVVLLAERAEGPNGTRWVIGHATVGLPQLGGIVGTTASALVASDNVVLPSATMRPTA